MIGKKGGPGSRGAKFKLSRTGQVEYFHHGNTQHPAGQGLAHPNLLAVKLKPVHKPSITAKTAKGADKNKSPLSKLTKLAKPSPYKSSKAVNHHMATGHTNLMIKRG